MNFDQDKEIRQMWQESSPAVPGDAAQLTRTIAMTVQKFDRRILLRNLREYAAGAVVMGFFLWYVIDPAKAIDPVKRLLAAAGMVTAVFMMIRLWLGQRGTPPLDPAADVRSYQAALLDRYDRQIRLLLRARWRYVFPAYLWMVLVNVIGPGQSPLRRVGGFLASTAFSGFVVWFIENYQVPRLRIARKHAESLLHGPE